MSIVSMLPRLTTGLLIVFLLEVRVYADDATPEAGDVLARESALVQQARSLARESQIVKEAQSQLQMPVRQSPVPESIRNLLAREAALLASVSDRPLKTSVPTDRVTLAQKLVQNEDYRMAKTLLKDIAESSGATEDERARAELLQAQISLHEGRSSDAVVELSSWLAEFPRRREAPFLYFLLGQSYRDLGAYEQARDNFYRVMSSSLISASSSDSAAFTKEKRLVRAAVWELAETEYEQHQWERSLTFFQRFNTQNPSGDQLVEASLFRKADCLYQLRRLNESIQAYEKALSVAPFHPFATEAWLRLYFLYGATNQPRQQTEAICAMSWLVNTLHPSRIAYWQQRGVALVMELPAGAAPQLVQLRESLRGKENDEGWKPLCTYLDEMCSRLTLGQTVQKAAAGADDWSKWQGEYLQRREQLQENSKTWLEKRPINEPVTKKSVSTES